MPQDNIVPLRSLSRSRRHAQHQVRSQYRLPLEGMREHWLQVLGEMMQLFCDELAQAGLRAYRDDLRLAVGKVVERHPQIVQTYLETAVKEFDIYWGHEPARAIELAFLRDPDYDNLSEHELEELTALDLICEAAVLKYGDNLQDLDARFAEMKMPTVSGEINNPLAPQVLALLFRRVLNLIAEAWNTEVRLICYRCFDQSVLRYLGGVVDDWNTLLSNEGLRPDLPTSGGHINIQEKNQILLNKNEKALTERPIKPSLLPDFYKEIEAESLLQEDVKELLHGLASAMHQVDTSSPDFLANAQHPAYKLVNLLCEIGLSINNQASSQEQELLQQIERQVAPLGAIERGDLGLVDSVYQGAKHVWGLHLLEAAEQSQRLIDSREYHERLHLGRKKVKALLEPIIDAHAHVPELIDLMREAWHDVLFLHLMRDGENSQTWRMQLQVLKELVWSVQEKSPGPERKFMLQRIPGLLSQIKDGLIGISFDQQRSNELLNGLQQAHIRVLGGKSNSDECYLTEVDYLDEDSQLVPPSYPDQNMLGALSAQGLEAGQWIAIKQSNRIVKAKIIWQSQATGSSLLADSSGQRLNEITQEQMLAWVDSTELSMLSTEHYSDVLLGRGVNAINEASA